jgi:uncharacterized membrane protein
MRARYLLRLAACLTFIAAITALVYRGILLPAGSVPVYPWASDTLGHVLKVEYLGQQLRAGVAYPDLLPHWYAGLQMLRYHPPFPYYVLLLLKVLTGSALLAANWFIALCALAGGLGWLTYRRWIGWLPAAIGGALYTFLPDNIRVALAEGNLPRVLATAIVPWAIYLLIRSLEETGRPRHRLALGLCFMLIVLSHAMMAAIYAACCALLCILLWIGRRANAQRATAAIASIALGILLAGWWFLPSLIGGITELNASAMTEALAVFPLTTYLNPSLRAGNPEIVYPGAALLLSALVLLFIRRGRDPYAIGLSIVGFFGILITTPGFNAAFNALPMHHLFWPLRFLGFASFCLLLAVIWRLRELRTRLWVVVPVLIVGLLVGDGLLSLRLIFLRPARPEVTGIARQLATAGGWREATLDYSRLGSAPSYFFTAVGGREQIYGWAYQGAHTATTVSAIDEALQQGYTSYVIDRLNLLGVDDVVRLQTEPMAPDLPARLSAAGFSTHNAGTAISWYHRDGAPRAIRAHWRALGIGRGAQNFAYLFPQIIRGGSRRVDDYSLEELASYDALVLAGFEWNDRGRAEELVGQVAQAGVRVLVDLTGIPDDPLARQPRFLGVWGERITLGHAALVLEGDGQTYQLLPFTSAFPSWNAYSPQGLDVEALRHPYFGTYSAALGYRQVGSGRVWFVGDNLPYHAVLTRDPTAIQLLGDTLGLPADQTSSYQTVPLRDYTASARGYRFSYALDQSDMLLIPIANHDGLRVYVDGQPARRYSFERLLAFQAPAGQHRVSISLAPTSIYYAGLAVSVLALLGMATVASLPWGKSRRKGQDHEQNQLA